MEGECSRLRSLFKQKGQETEDLDRVVKRLQEERGKVSDIIRQEFADRLVKFTTALVLLLLLLLLSLLSLSLSLSLSMSLSLSLPSLLLILMLWLLLL